MSKSPAPFDQGLFLTHLHKGKEFFDHDQLEKAREELEAANQLRPHDEKVLNMLGMTYYKLEMLPEAEEMYITLAAGNPEIYALQSNLGLIQLKLNKLEEARDSLNRALELQPSNSKAHFYMGLLYEKKEMWEDALYHFEQAKAEKMVAKMQSKMDENQNPPELVLPYEVIEVLPSDLDSGPDLASTVEQEMAQEPQIVASEAETTGRMRAQDLATAMFQIHNDELVAPPEPSEEPEVTSMETEVRSEPDDSIPTRVEQEQEEAAIEDDNSSADLMVEQIKQQIHDESPWEKTHPSIFPEHFGSEPEIHTENDSNLLIGSAVDEPFLLSDEIAADISTFLAESRGEENAEEDVFYQEPILPELTILNAGERPPFAEKYPTEANESRIPTPEEVENEIGELIGEADPSQLAEVATEQPVEAIATEELDNKIPLDEPVEDLLEELPIESEPEPPVSVQEETGEAEILEVHFAVNEPDDDGQIQEGFLQPSYLTPEFEDRNLEVTQDMADSPIARADSAPPAEEVPVPPQEVLEESAHSSAEPETTEPAVESAPAIETVATAEIQQEKQEIVRPANLDQFSKDRLYIQPLVGSDRFLLIDPHLLEIIISEKLVCRTGTISSYTGNLQFSPWGAQESKEKNPLIVVSGNGILFLADRRKEIFLISLNNEVIFVESNHLLVAQSSLVIEPQILQDQSTDTFFTVSKISGRGTLALTCLTKPLTVNVHEGLPANIPAHAVIAWSGRVVSEVLDDTDLRKVMMSPNQESMFLRFRGTGDVVVEQGRLWGDRRGKRQ